MEDIANVRNQFSDVVILAHPECSPEVVEASDFSGGTTAMAGYIAWAKAPRYLLLRAGGNGRLSLRRDYDQSTHRSCTSGRILSELLEELGLSQYRLAQDVGVAPMRISHLVRGQRPVTAELALRLGRVLLAESALLAELAKPLRHGCGRTESWFTSGSGSAAFQRRCVMMDGTEA